MRYQNLCWDMDGTLLETHRGISTALRMVAKEFDVEDQIPYDQPHLYVGPPLIHFTREVMGWDEDFSHAFSTRMTEANRNMAVDLIRPYDGILALLEKTQSAGMVNYICTAKQQTNAEQLADHFGFSPFVKALYGGMDHTDSKTAILSRLLAREELNRAQTVMIGDRFTDLNGGRENGTHTLGVLFGYGTKDELEPLHPDAIVETVAELEAYLLSRA